MEKVTKLEVVKRRLFSIFVTGKQCRHTSTLLPESCNQPLLSQTKFQVQGDISGDALQQDHPTSQTALLQCTMCTTVFLINNRNSAFRVFPQ